MPPKWISTQHSSNWKDLADWEKGESLINLISCGCNAPGLAEELPCSASTIYRYMDIADLAAFLSEQEWAVVQMGFSPARFLRKWAPKHRWACHYERQPRFIELLAEQQSGAQK